MVSGACLVVSGACQVVSDACLVRVSWCLEHVWCMSGGVGITGSDMPSALSPVFNTISLWSNMGGKREKQDIINWRLW